QADGLRRFVASLLDEGLIRPRDGAVSGQALKPLAAWDAAALKVESFNDMQDMLTLDPIHEIDDDYGWPRPAGEPGQPSYPRLRLSEACAAPSSLSVNCGMSREELVLCTRRSSTSSPIS